VIGSKRRNCIRKRAAVSCIEEGTDSRLTVDVRNRYAAKVLVKFNKNCKKQRQTQQKKKKANKNKNKKNKKKRGGGLRKSN